MQNKNKKKKMPNLYFDQSAPAVTWRGGTHDGQFSLKRLRDENFKTINLSRNGKMFHQPNTVVGKRNGNPHGQDTDYLYLQQLTMNPYPNGKNPFLSDSVEDMYPRTYGEANPIGGTNGTIRNVSSVGGTPLALSLDDGTELLQRVHTEAFRMDPRNPLSGQFALDAFLARGSAPELGPMSNYMRQGLASEAEDAYVLNQKMAAGFLRTEFDNIPHKMHEKLTERNNLNKTSQQIKSAKDKLHRTDPTGVLQGGPGNMIEKTVKREIEQDMKPPGGGDDGPDGIQGMKEHAQVLQKDLDTSDTNDDGGAEFQDALEKKPETVAEVPKRDERTWGQFLGEVTSFGGFKGKPNVTGGGGHEPGIKGPFSGEIKGEDVSDETLVPAQQVIAKTGHIDDHKTNHKGLLKFDDPTRNDSGFVSAQDLAGVSNTKQGKLFPSYELPSITSGLPRPTDQAKNGKGGLPQTPQPKTQKAYNHTDYSHAGRQEKKWMQDRHLLHSNSKKTMTEKMQELRQHQTLKYKNPNDPLYFTVPHYGR